MRSTRIRVAESGKALMARCAAKRPFREATLDFAGVKRVGQRDARSSSSFRAPRAAPGTRLTARHIA